MKPFSEALFPQGDILQTLEWVTVVMEWRRDLFLALKFRWPCHLLFGPGYQMGTMSPASKLFLKSHKNQSTLLWPTDNLLHCWLQLFQWGEKTPPSSMSETQQAGLEALCNASSLDYQSWLKYLTFKGQPWVVQATARYLLFKILKTQLTEIPVHLYFSPAPFLLTSPPKMENNQNAKSVCGPLHSETGGWYNRTAPLTFIWRTGILVLSIGLLTDPSPTQNLDNAILG